MTIKTFTTSHKKSGHMFLTQWRVATEPGSLTEAHMGSDWFRAVGAGILGIEKMTIQHEVLLDGSTPKTEEQWAACTRFETYTVIHTFHGSACIIDFVDRSEMGGVVVNGGRKPKSLTLGTWRKYGDKRGHGMSYLRALAGRGLCTSPERGRDVCRAEAYGRLGSAAFSGYVKT